MRRGYVLVLYLINVCPCRTGVDSANNGVFTDCSAVLEEPRGIIQTPNFPGPFPSPISCHWLIKAPPHKKVILYFTQFYVRLSFHVAEFDYYENDRNYSGLNELGAISFIDMVTSLVAYKPYVLVSFMTPADISNINLRVDEYLLDVYGFNITYEVVDREQSVREHACSVHDCSFLGNCLASVDFLNYTCHCFDDYFGDQCQYGPYCDPKRNINMCQNGGKCRYLYGSLVNTCECPPEFEGPQCQFPKPYISSECQVLGCSQKCLRDEHNKYRCVCEDGYKLADDNATCVEEGRFRVVVGVLIHSVNNTPPVIPKEAVDSKDFLRSLKTKVSNACDHWGSGVCDISRLGISSFRNTTGGHLLEFYFYCEKSDIQKVENGIRILVSGGSIQPFVINQQYLEIRTDPALHLLDVQNYDKRPAIQGKLLTLVCTARGSEFLNFRWFKDGALVKAHETNRNAWEQRVPATVHETQLDILNIENVSPLDKGLFTCEVTDYNEVENKSITVDVIEPPAVEVNTLSATVIYGRPLSLNCLSPEDTRGLFKYAWFRGKKPLDPTENGEVVEDLLPTGVRLTMKKTLMSANYSCVVTNEAGNSSLTISVYVISRNDSESLCAEELLAGTRWMPTAPGGFDEHKCPLNSRGFIKRYCRCDVDIRRGCSWSDVNHAGCKSQEFLQISSKIQSLLLGYQHSTTLQVLDMLTRYLNKTTELLYIGDLNGAAEDLYHLLAYTYTFKVGRNDSDQFIIPLKRTLSLLDRILYLSQSATEEESMDLQVFHWGFATLKLIASQDKTTLEVEPGVSIRTDSIVFTYTAGSPDTVSATDTKRDQAEISHTVKKPVDQYSDQSEPSYIIKISNRRFNIPTFIAGKKPFKIITDLFLIRPERSQKDIAPSKRLTIPMVVEHKQPIGIGHLRNLSSCVQWETVNTAPYEGAWIASECMVLSQDPWKTTCLCPYSAMVAVALGDVESFSTDTSEYSFTHLLIILGCVFPLCSLVVTLVFHLLLYQNLNGDMYAINTNVVISLIVANGILLFCVNNPHTQVFCVAGRLLLYFFYLAAFSFLLMDALSQFLVLYRNIPRFGFAFRYFIVGWGIPSIFIVILVSLFVADYNNGAYSCRHLCWMTYEHDSNPQQFAAMIAPVGIIVLVYIVISSMTVVSLVKWKDEVRHIEKKQNLYRVGYSSFIMLILLVVGIIKAYIENSGYDVHFYVFFMFFNTTLGLSILILRCFCDNQVRKRIFCSKDVLHVFPDKSPAQSSIPLVGINSNTSGYVRGQKTIVPENRSGNLTYSGSAVGTSSISNDYSRRKEHLLSLLGTNTAYNGVPLGDNPDNNVLNHADQNQRDTFLDSGIFEGSDPEKMSTASGSMKEKGAFAQGDKSLCGRMCRSSLLAEASNQENACQYRSSHRLSKCSDNSSFSNGIPDGPSKDQSEFSANSLQMKPKYTYSYTEIIGTVSGPKVCEADANRADQNGDYETSTLLTDPADEKVYSNG